MHPNVRRIYIEMLYKETIMGIRKNPRGLVLIYLLNELKREAQENAEGGIESVMNGLEFT